jgi:hypothetical protein
MGGAVPWAKGIGVSIRSCFWAEGIAMNREEAQGVLSGALGAADRLTYADLVVRAPALKGRTRLMGLILSETYEPVGGGYSCEMVTAPSGTRYNVSIEVYWSNYVERMIGVQVCVDDGGESARRPLCESIEVGPPRK